MSCQADRRLIESALCLSPCTRSTLRPRLRRLGSVTRAVFAASQCQCPLRLRCRPAPSPSNATDEVHFCRNITVTSVADSSFFLPDGCISVTNSVFIVMYSSDLNCFKTALARSYPSVFLVTTCTARSSTSVLFRSRVDLRDSANHYRPSPAAASREERAVPLETHRGGQTGAQLTAPVG